MAVSQGTTHAVPTYDHHRVSANLKWHGTVAGQQHYNSGSYRHQKQTFTLYIVSV